MSLTAIVTMVIGFLLIGTGGYLVYHRLEEVLIAIGKLKEVTK